MKKSKLNLKRLSVKSFVTAGHHVKGGSNITCHPTNCENTGTVTGPGATGNTCGCNNSQSCTNCGNTGNTGGSDGNNYDSVRICVEGTGDGGVETFFTACPSDRTDC